MDYLIIFNLVLLTIILIIILIIVFKEKKENFIGSTIENSTLKVINVLTGVEGNQYSTVNIENEQVIIFKQNSQFTIPENMSNCKILIVGGGGGGRSSTPGSGGGAGAFIYLTNITLSEGNYSVIIGNGGRANENGGDSSISLENSVIYLAKGGGGGEQEGGSNGGGDLNSNKDTLTINTPSGKYGNKGGTNNFYTVTNRQGRRTSYIDYKYAGGGGGAGGAGGNGSRNNPGDGGAGIQNDITGTNISYAAGGGGGSYINASAIGSTGGSGGSGIGGNGGRGNLRTYTEASSGIQNTGSGGGGSGKIIYSNGNPINSAGSGGSGIVIIRYTPIVIPVAASEGRIKSELELNISPPELNGLNISDIPDNYFGQVSPIREINNLYTQTGITGRPNGLDPKNYIVSFSSYINETTSPIKIFNFDNTIIGDNFGGFFDERRYTPSTGDFISSSTVRRININITRTINNTETTYNNLTLIDTNNNPLTGIRELKGEFIKLTCPELITVVGYHFMANLGFENQAPGAWILLARNTTNLGTSSAYKILDSSEINTNNEFVRNSWEIYYNSQQIKRCFIQNNRDMYDEYLFIFPKLASTNIRNNVNYGHQLIFREIKLYQLSTDNQQQLQ